MALAGYFRTLFIPVAAVVIVVIIIVAAIQIIERLMPWQSLDANYGITRYIDEEAGVICWKIFESGISCLPINETTLDWDQTNQ